MSPKEIHRSQHLGWLRAAVLGANDGLISTSSLVIGVAGAQVVHGTILVTAVAGAVAGALSMAAGEYVSVSSQADMEQADLDKERGELEADPESERLELARIYERRGLTPQLATEVAVQLMQHDALGAHARDELGLSEVTAARPLQAAMASAASFVSGALPAVIITALVPTSHVAVITGSCTLVLLATLGYTGGRLGGAAPIRGAARVVFWGSVAMIVSAMVGRLFGG
jgi:VIT1/CCC1 family predicted Fe2+/Mn2+ transporter